MTQFRFFVALFTAALIGLASQIAQAEQRQDSTTIPGGLYHLDSRHASLYWQVKHLGFSYYTGRFNDFDASFIYDPQSPQDTLLTVTVDPASLDLNYPEFEEELRGADWLNTDEYPEITFTSNNLEVTGEDTARLYGDLTFLGVTQPLEMDVTLVGSGLLPRHDIHTLGFQGQAVLDRSLFGMDVGIPYVDAEVIVHINAEFNHVPEMEE